MMRPVLVVRSLFTDPDTKKHVERGSIISDPIKMAYALAQHPEKVVRATHEVTESPRRRSEPVVSEAPDAPEPSEAPSEP